MGFWHPKCRKYQQRMFTPADREKIIRKKGMYKEAKRAWTARGKRMCGCDRNFQSQW